MATSDELRKLAGSIGEIPTQATVCQEVALALIEVGRQWFRRGRFEPQTDYQVARRVVMGTAERAQQQLATVRRTTLNAELVRADAAVERVLACCGSCPGLNEARIARGERFQCQVVAQEQPVVLRFSLDKEGLIVERQ